MKTKFLLLAIDALLMGLISISAQAQRQAAAVATIDNGVLRSITVTDGGAGYTTAPAVIIAGGGGSGATAVAVLSGDAVGEITVLAGGTGYITVPDVIISLPDIDESILNLVITPRMTIYGDVGSTNQIQWASAFGNTNVWTVLTNLVIPSNPFVFYDTISPPGLRRFYRSIVLGGTHPTAPIGFVWLPAGRFTMGSPDSEQNREPVEGPQTAVTLTKGFFICAHLVTQGEYESLIGNNPSGFPGDTNRPVETVSWVDATNYCAALTDRERTAGRLPNGYIYSLPTEAQWEYAARAGSTSRFSFGDDLGFIKVGEFAWYNGNSGDTTHPVATKHPNRWGLYDMGGNVWEWCSDFYVDFYPGGNVLDPTGPTTGTVKVYRGGSWSNGGQLCRCAQRGFDEPSRRWDILGFRVVLVPVP